MKRLEAKLGVRLLNGTTRSVGLTEAGRALLLHVEPALTVLETAAEAISEYKSTHTGTLRLNVPVRAARLILPRLLPSFMKAHPDINVEVLTQESFVDVVAEGCAARIRYGERLQQNMVAIPIGPRVQRIATAAAPTYLNRHGRPAHPRDLVEHDGSKTDRCQKRHIMLLQQVARGATPT